MTWTCEQCGETVQPVAVTNDERHDVRAGGCGGPVIPAPPLVEWADLLAALKRSRRWIEDTYGEGSQPVFLDSIIARADLARPEANE